MVPLGGKNEFMPRPQNEIVVPSPSRIEISTITHVTLYDSPPRVNLLSYYKSHQVHHCTKRKSYNPSHMVLEHFSQCHNSPA